MKELSKEITDVTKKIKLKTKASGLDEVAYIYFLSIIGFLLGVVLLVWFALGYVANKENKGFVFEEPEETEVVDSCEFRRLLDGVCVDSVEEQNPQVVGVMIDNHPDARPQSGLSDASLVYEAPVEGNYTRYFALFLATQEVNKVGPVRSARPYFLDLASEYGRSLYMHVGGSPEALDFIKMHDVLDLNEFYGGWYFWRDSARSAPHNTYTQNKLWNTFLEDKEIEPLSYKKLKFSEATECEENCVNKITIPFLPPSFKPVWIYEEGRYVRYAGNFKDLDLNGKNITADTIIIQKTKVETIDAVGRKHITTIGEGDAIIFQKGNMIVAKWKKEDLSDRTKFFDENGNLIAINPGKIWIEVVGEETEVSFE